MTKPLWGRAKDFPDTEPMSTLPRIPPGEDSMYADTEPMPLVLATTPGKAPADRFGGLSLAPVEATLYDVQTFARKENRICPQPSRWLEFYRVLQDAVGLGAALPAQPLVGSAWAVTPPLAKRMAFHEQLEWADRNGCLQAAHEYLKSLRDADWYVG
jgi:hypothetical protein